MIDKQNLSKYRYIYFIQEDDAKDLVIINYPIIYINEKIVYYKVPGSQYLGTISTDWINTHEVEYARGKTDSKREKYYEAYAGHPSDIKAIFQSIKADKSKYEEKSSLLSAEEDVTYYENMVIKAERELDRLKKKLADAEEKLCTIQSQS